MSARKPQLSPRSPRPSQRLLIGALAALLIAGVATANAAPGGTPHPPAAPVGQDYLPASTQYTPVPTDGCKSGWEQLAGATVPGAPACDMAAGVRYDPATSPVPVTVDFFAAAFTDVKSGLAGGAACAPGTAEAGIETCARHPALWQYTTGIKGGSWSEVALPGSTTPGYIAAIRYMPDGNVLAVGGDGVYPRREVGHPATQSDADWISSDPAGHARAWLRDSHGWRELTGLPTDMRALTALDFSQQLDNCPDAHYECGFAGALAQIWQWHDGHFLASPETLDAQPARAALVTFRIRGISFRPGHVRNQFDAIAGTSGCCAANPSQNTPRILSYADDVWHVENGASYGRGQLPDSIYAVSTSNVSGFGGGSRPGASFVFAPGGPPQAGEPSSQVSSADLYGAASTGEGGYGLDNLLFTGVGSPVDVPATGVPFPGRPNSSPGGFRPGSLTPGATTSDVRLVSGDGDISSSCSGDGCSLNGPDGMMDWAVGEFPSTGQAAAVTTAYQQHSGVLDNPTGADQLPVQRSGTVPSPRSASQIQGSYASQFLFSLPSWRLNALAAVGQTGTDWAVGDRGAILRLGPAPPSVVSDSHPPTLGAPDPTPFSERGAYETFRGLVSRTAGTVPALASQPLEHLTAPAFTPGGTADDVRDPSDTTRDVSQIVMSRDGSEGWAVGSGFDGGSSGMLTLDHYDGVRWTACDSEGVAGLVDAGPACAGLAALNHFRDATGQLAPTSLLSAARVPVELGSDSSRANDFEVVAVGTLFSSSSAATAAPVVLRYGGGRWAQEPDSATQAIQSAAVNGRLTELTEVVFTAPDDGWALGDAGPGSVAGDNPYLFHFDGKRWVDCAAAAAGATACGDLGAVLPVHGPYAFLDPPVIHLATSGTRAYLYGDRTVDASGGAGASGTEQHYPLILYHDRAESCGAAGDKGCWRSADGGLDPAFAPPPGGPPQHARGRVFSLALSQSNAAPKSGWAVGEFGRDAIQDKFGSSSNGVDTQSAFGDRPSSLLRLSGTEWTPWRGNDVAADYLTMNNPNQPGPGLIGPRTTVVSGTTTVIAGQRIPLLSFSMEAKRWELAGAPFVPNNFVEPYTGIAEGDARSLAADGQGGYWVAVHQRSATGGPSHTHVFFYHHTSTVHKSVFTDVPHPVRQQIYGLSAAGDGSLWVAAAGGVLYRYDRLVGWDRIRVSGWDAGRVVTNPSPVYAVATGPDGQGVAVGSGGRIADIAGSGAVLDAAAGTVCDVAAVVAPCGTSHSLRAVSVAPDGSAMAGGDNLALLWRRAGGQFEAIAKPSAVASTQITGVSLPTPDKAWISTRGGEVYAGSMMSGRWTWALESTSVDGEALSRDAAGRPQALNAIAVDAGGHGYAVGDGGVVLERGVHDAGTWTRVPTGFLYRLSSVTVSPGGVEVGALIGGDWGLVLTRVAGRLAVAHEADPFDALQGQYSYAPTVTGVAISPGLRDGQVEAWAASQASREGQGDERPAGLANAIMHYSSDPADTLLDAGTTRATPLPDSPARKAGELSVAAFGKSECNLPFDQQCPEMTGTNLQNEVIARRVTQEVAARAPSLAVFTGDVNDSAGGPSASSRGGGPVGPTNLPTDLDLNHRRWSELIARPLASAGIPLYGALGAQDLNHADNCSFAVQGGTGYHCRGGREHAAGTNFGWRQTFADMSAPWGSLSPPSTPDLVFSPVRDDGKRTDDVHADDPSGTTSGPTVPAGGASTHYAVDISPRTTPDKPTLRLVALDTSMGSLSAESGQQNPVEAGGQLAWLKSVLCVHGSPGESGALPCTRQPGQRVVVLSNTPTYSYGPGSGADTLTDGTTLETLLVQNHVNAVISGRLGWNALYYILAAGLHSPCPGGSYPAAPPSSIADACSASSVVPGAPGTPDAATQLAESLQGTGAPATQAAGGAAGVDTAATGVVPVIDAASAGGKFGPADGGSGAGGSASDGYWHGYSMIRIQPDGNVIVEQRPVFDWVGISAATHVLHPGQRMTLGGFGREPVGAETAIRYDEISSPAVTHRYDLLQADPRRPWLPMRDASGHYQELSDAYPNCSAGCLTDSQSGRVRSGKGSHGRVYAVGLLSVGDKAASWPIVFEPRRSYVPPPPVVIPAVPSLPPIHVGSALATTTPPAAAPPPPPPSVGTPTLPSLPGLPTLPALSSPPPAVAPPTVQPPPAPPASQPPSGLSLTISPQQVSFAPPSGVIPPPAPPIQPAPPGGAQREARQKQAAAAKSEEGSGGEGASADGGGDLAQAPPSAPGSQMTRHSPSRQEHAFTRRDQAAPVTSFTPVVRAGQPSAWSQYALDVGALVLMAAVFALGFTGVRPTPRGRRPELPMPAWARRPRR